ncbi:DUF421 domain-containing protein [Bacillus sp. ISL-34]|uniref:DUF421 domain-containing protein n=1 Tax=Bacillus sp. ISL-34 TaxID=2819121 RepID=UPI001BEC5B76|nr:YetF domain-containing protein [Bacillus sp. ISL-34]MBT2650085.1 DUF421 domain-containing protein [Bacillus sp. ISL-34]
MGKKAAREMNGIDLIIVMVMGTAISEPIVSKKLGTATWYSVSIALLYVLYSYLELNNKFKKWLVPKETILIDKGDILENGLRKERLEIETLIAQMRVNGYTDIKDIYRATMEQTGEISFIPNEDVRPLQPRDIHLQPTPTYIPIPIIIDGEIQTSNLNYLVKDEDWLILQLSSYNLDIKDLDKVVLDTYNIRGFLDLILKGK